MGTLADRYIASWYFAVMTMTTIGYGDITATTALERITAGLMMFGGALFYAIVISSVTDILMTLSARDTHYKRLTDDLNELFTEYQIAGDVRRSCRQYLRAKYSTTHGDYQELLQELSPDLRECLASQLYVAWGSTSEYFHEAPGEFYAKAASMFTEVSYPVGERIIDLGERVKDLFILSRGIVLSRGLVKRASFRSTVCFGEDLLFSDRSLSFKEAAQSTYIVLALCFVIVQHIPQDRLAELMDEFPTVQAQVKRASLRQAFRSNVFAYASAVRIRQDKSLLPAATDVNLVKLLVYKLWALEFPQGDDAATTIQKVFRAHIVRKHSGLGTNAICRNSSWQAGDKLADIVKDRTKESPKEGSQSRFKRPVQGGHQVLEVSSENALVQRLDALEAEMRTMVDVQTQRHKELMGVLRPASVKKK